MGKGKSVRRRAANAERANQGNLHKASLGKASAHMPLPPPPREQDIEDKQSKSMRKMLRLKEHALKPRSRPGGAGPRRPLAPAAAAGDDGGGDAEGRGADGPASTSEHEPAPEPQRRGGLDVGPAGFAALFQDPHAKKGMKASKKEFLKAKSAKKKKKQGGPVDHLPGQHTPITTFGEQPAPQPLQVQLKRKHFVTKSAGERCKEIFLDQLTKAGTTQQPRRAGSAAAAAPVRKGPMKKKPTMGVKQTEALALLRQQAIDAYRAQRSSRSPGATADLASLAKLAQGKAASLALQ